MQLKAICGPGATVQWYNEHRAHTTLDGRTPNEIYFHRFPANRKPRFDASALLPGKKRPLWTQGPSDVANGLGLVAEHYFD